MKNEKYIIEKYEIYKGCDVVVDYQSQHDQDIIDHFEEKSNFEGWASLLKIDFNKGFFYIDELKDNPISIEHLIMINQISNDLEFIDILDI